MSVVDYTRLSEGDGVVAVPIVAASATFATSKRRYGGAGILAARSLPQEPPRPSSPKSVAGGAGRSADEGTSSEDDPNGQSIGSVDNSAAIKGVSDVHRVLHPSPPPSPAPGPVAPVGTPPAAKAATIVGLLIVGVAAFLIIKRKRG
jgi:hypothetical protein